MRAAAVLLALTVATTAAAQGRLSTRSLPCRQAAALVQRSGAIVLNTGPVTYERFVRDGSFCVLGETTEPAFVLTADAAQCLIGYRCRSLDYDF